MPDRAPRVCVNWFVWTRGCRFPRPVGGARYCTRPLLWPCVRRYNRVDVCGRRRLASFGCVWSLDGPGFRGGVVQVHGLQERATIPHGLTTGDFTVGPVYGTRSVGGPIIPHTPFLPELANLPLSLRPIRARRPSESGNRPSAAVSAPAGPRRAACGPRSGNGPGAPGPPGPGSVIQATNFYSGAVEGARSSGGREGAARARTGGPRGWGTRTARGGVRVPSAARTPARPRPRPPRTKRGPWFEKISSWSLSYFELGMVSNRANSYPARCSGPRGLCSSGAEPLTRYSYVLILTAAICCASTRGIT